MSVAGFVLILDIGGATGIVPSVLRGRQVSKVLTVRWVLIPTLKAGGKANLVKVFAIDAPSMPCHGIIWSSRHTTFKYSWAVILLLNIIKGFDQIFVKTAPQLHWHLIPNPPPGTPSYHHCGKLRNPHSLDPHNRYTYAFLCIPAPECALTIGFCCFIVLKLISPQSRKGVLLSK